MVSGRFPALAVAEDGTFYPAGGMNGHTQLLRWHPGSPEIHGFFNLWDASIGDHPARIHDIAVDSNHQLYLGENNHHHRSSYLWTAQLPAAGPKGWPTENPGPP